MRRSCQYLVLIFACVALIGCDRKSKRTPPAAVPGPAAASQDLAAARQGFATQLRVRGPAPQAHAAVRPPAGVREVEYVSGDLRLKGWLSAAPADGKRHPAVVFLHGGFAFAEEDWRDAAPFAEAGFVLFMPMLRGENGNPGNYESFYGEVDDAVAAGAFVASLPHVAPERVFVAGHSVGGVLTTLVSMVPSQYKSAAALSGWLDMTSWAAQSSGAEVPYRRDDAREVRLRDPMAFAGSLRCPLVLYVESPMRGVNERFRALAAAAGKDCRLVIVPGDHHSMVAPAVRNAIEQFRGHAATPTPPR